MGAGGGVGLGILTPLEPVSYLHGIIRNASLTFNGGASAVNCTGGENNRLVGGAGGVGFVVSSPALVEHLRFDVSDASIVDCVGGNNNSVGGSGGIGLAMWNNDLGRKKPHPGVISDASVRVARATIIGCRGGDSNDRFGGGGGLGVAIFNDLGSVNDNVVVLDSSRIERCVGGKGNKYASGSGGVGVTVQARTGIVSGEQLRIENSTLTACEADSGGGAALFIRGVGAEGHNALELHHTVLEENVARGRTGCGGGGLRALFIPSLPKIKWPPVIPGGTPDDYNNFQWIYNATAVPAYVRFQMVHARTALAFILLGVQPRPPHARMSTTSMHRAHSPSPPRPITSIRARCDEPSARVCLCVADTASGRTFRLSKYETPRSARIAPPAHRVSAAPRTSPTGTRSSLGAILPTTRRCAPAARSTLRAMWRMQMRASRRWTPKRSRRRGRITQTGL